MPTMSRTSTAWIWSHRRQLAHVRRALAKAALAMDAEVTGIAVAGDAAGEVVREAVTAADSTAAAEAVAKRFPAYRCERVAQAALFH